MARRRPRRPGAQPVGRRPARAGASWINWLAVIGVGLLVLIMVVTMIPLG